MVNKKEQIRRSCSVLYLQVNGEGQGSLVSFPSNFMAQGALKSFITASDPPLFSSCKVSKPTSKAKSRQMGNQSSRGEILQDTADPKLLLKLTEKGDLTSVEHVSAYIFFSWINFLAGIFYISFRILLFLVIIITLAFETVFFNPNKLCKLVLLKLWCVHVPEHSFF